MEFRRHPSLLARTAVARRLTPSTIFSSSRYAKHSLHDRSTRAPSRDSHPTGTHLPPGKYATPASSAAFNTALSSHHSGNSSQRKYPPDGGDDDTFHPVDAASFTAAS